MKKLSILILMLFAFAKASFADVADGTPFKPGDQFVVVVKDSVTGNTNWTSNNVYIITGWVYVVAGATLNIEAGTVIVGDKNSKGTLIVERGGKIMANGTKEKPVIFTSNEPQGDRNAGDWGGVIICGKASTNFTAGEAQIEGGPRSFYGGTDDNDNSGKLSFVRIEFAGIPQQPGSETNGLTLCGVGAATQIDHVQVTYGGDDAFEWFGGTVNGKYLVSLGNLDDDFDTDAQYRGKNQFCVVVREQGIADASGSKAFESDSYLTGSFPGTGGPSDTTHTTAAVFSNCTIIGPVGSNPALPAFSTNYISAVHLRRGSAQSIVNSVFAGWPCAVLMDESSSSYGPTTANIGNGSLQFRNNLIAGTFSAGVPSPKDVIYVKNGARDLTVTTAYADTTTGNPFAPYAGPWTWLRASANGNFVYATEGNGSKLWNPWALLAGKPNDLNLVPQSQSPICHNTKSLPSYIPAGTFPLNRYPFDPKKPINTDTSNLFVNFNAPDVLPDFTNSKASDPFFEKVNYVGAFAGTQSASDNWMNGWTNFEPNETYYVPAGISTVNRIFDAATVYPNPAKDLAKVNFELFVNSDVKISVYDITGKMVMEIFNGKATAGKQTYVFNTSELNNGLYFVNIATNDKQQIAKLKIVH